MKVSIVEDTDDVRLLFYLTKIEDCWYINEVI